MTPTTPTKFIDRVRNEADGITPLKEKLIFASILFFRAAAFTIMVFALL